MRTLQVKDTQAVLLIDDNGKTSYLEATRGSNCNNILIQALIEIAADPCGVLPLQEAVEHVMRRKGFPEGDVLAVQRKFASALDAEYRSLINKGGICA